MCSAYATKKVLYLFLILLFVVEASLLEKEEPSLYELIHTLRRKHQREAEYLKSRVFKSNNLAPRAGPDGNVDIRWDMKNETDGSYSANITISNYLNDGDFTWPWKLGFIWVKKETLLSTLSAEEGTQHGFVSLKNDTYCLNNVTFVDLLPQQSDDDDSCKGGVIPRWFGKTDIENISFQISVSHSNIGEQQPPSHVNLTTGGLEYVSECDEWMQVTNILDYHNTHRTTCILSISNLHEIHNKEEL